MDELNQVIQNRKRPKGGHCETVLGSRDELSRAASAWNSLAGMFQVIVASELLDFCSDELSNFDSKEFKAFKKGVSAIPAFLTRAAIEVAELKNNKEDSQLKK